jgi:hypothetical protein
VEHVHWQHKSSQIARGVATGEEGRRHDRVLWARQRVTEARAEDEDARKVLQTAEREHVRVKRAMPTDPYVFTTRQSIYEQYSDEEVEEGGDQGEDQGGGEEEDEGEAQGGDQGGGEEADEGIFRARSPCPPGDQEI